VLLKNYTKKKHHQNWSRVNATHLIVAEKDHCCACNQKNIKASMIQAGEAISEDMTPSFLEVMHHMKHITQTTGESPCCGCDA